MFFWAVVSDSLQEAVELFTSREEAEAIVHSWDRDEPDQAGSLRVEKIELETRGTSLPPPRSVGHYPAPKLSLWVGLHLQEFEPKHLRRQRRTSRLGG